MPWQASPRTASSKATSTTAGKTARLQALQRDGYRCQLAIPGTCTGTATQADHITPVAQGGALTAANLQACCAPCHRAKTAQDAAEGRRRRGTTTRPPEPHPGLL